MRISVVFGPDTVGRDTEGAQAGDVARPMHRCVALECFRRPQGINPELVHIRMNLSAGFYGLKSGGREAGQLTRFTHSAAIVRLC